MRVICCPNCDEPLPGFANYCAICGETLIPSPTSTTARLSHRPRSLKVPRFFALRNESEETVPFGEVEPDDHEGQGTLPGSEHTRLFSEETVKLVQKPSRFSRESTIPWAQGSTSAIRR